jgi:hypothetical protein
MAIAAHRARDRGTSGDSRCLPESGRDRSAAAWGVGTASAGNIPMIFISLPGMIVLLLPIIAPAPYQQVKRHSF